MEISQFSYAYPHQKFRPESRANHPSRLHLKLPKLRCCCWRVNRIFWTTRESEPAQLKNPKNEMNFTLSDHENAFVKHCVCICSPFSQAFQFVLPARRHLHPRNYAYVEQDICLWASRIVGWEIETGFLATLHSCEVCVLRGLIMRNLWGVFLSFFIEQK